MNQIEKLLEENPEALVNRLGRLPAKDPRDEQYKIRMVRKPAGVTSRYWNDLPTFLDQGDKPHCVGYSWAHLYHDGPVRHKKGTIDPDKIYFEAQHVDEWYGNDYSGTSVRAGAKVLQSMGIISSYQWAFDLATMINCVLTTSPVVMGTDWTYDMFTPDKNGLIKVTGMMAGGHAFLVNGVNTKTKLFRIKNSWSKYWGLKGRAFIGFDDMEKLLLGGGECAMAIENK